MEAGDVVLADRDDAPGYHVPDAVLFQVAGRGPVIPWQDVMEAKRTVLALDHGAPGLPEPADGLEVDADEKRVRRGAGHAPTDRDALGRLELEVDPVEVHARREPEGNGLSWVARVVRGGVRAWDYCSLECRVPLGGLVLDGDRVLAGREAVCAVLAPVVRHGDIGGVRISFFGPPGDDLDAGPRDRVPVLVYHAPGDCASP